MVTPVNIGVPRDNFFLYQRFHTSLSNENFAVITINELKILLERFWSAYWSQTLRKVELARHAQIPT